MAFGSKRYICLTLVSNNLDYRPPRGRFCQAIPLNKQPLKQASPTRTRTRLHPASWLCVTRAHALSVFGKRPNPGCSRRVIGLKNHFPLPFNDRGKVPRVQRAVTNFSVQAFFFPSHKAEQTRLLVPANFLWFFFLFFGINLFERTKELKSTVSVNSRETI